MPSVTGRPEYSQVSSARHDSASHARSTRLRRTYFGVASLWGCAVGIVAVLGALQATGALATRPGPEALAYVVPAALIAVIGGLVVSRAYREAKRQGR